MRNWKSKILLTIFCTKLFKFYFQEKLLFQEYCAFNDFSKERQNFPQFEIQFSNKINETRKIICRKYE